MSNFHMNLNRLKTIAVDIVDEVRPRDRNILNIIVLLVKLK